MLSIGTAASSNLAGVGRDIVIATRLDVPVYTVVAAVSAQGPCGIQALETLSDDLVRAQCEVVPASEIGALRVGALTSAGHVRIVAELVRAYAHVPAVVDPVIAASLGGRFLDGEALALLGNTLLRLPSVIATPNLPEAAELLGIAAIAEDAMADAAQALFTRGARAVLLKGGHLAETPRDVLVDADGVRFFADSRIEGELHGSGCMLAAALACFLIRGRNLRVAVTQAREIVRAEMGRARSRGEAATRS